MKKFRTPTGVLGENRDMKTQVVRALLVLALVTALAAAQSVPDRVTVPLRVEKNRPFIMVTLHRVDGTRRTAKFLVDTGGGGFLITEAVARDVGLEWGTPSKEGGSQFAVVKKAPAALRWATSHSR